MYINLIVNTIFVLRLVPSIGIRLLKLYEITQVSQLNKSAFDAMEYAVKYKKVLKYFKISCTGI